MDFSKTKEKEISVHDRILKLWLRKTPVAASPNSENDGLIAFVLLSWHCLFGFLHLALSALKLVLLLEVNALRRIEL